MTQLELAINLRDWIEENGLGMSSLQGFLCTYTTSLAEFNYLYHELVELFEGD